jgi:hypothetical protein
MKKINAKQLRDIIKEEYANVLNESRRQPKRRKLNRKQLRQVIKEEYTKILEAAAKADPKGWGASGKLANLAGKGKSGAYGSGYEKSKNLDKEIKKLLGHG